MTTPHPTTVPPPTTPTGSSDDKLWIILSHISIVFGAGLILPLVVYLWKKDQHGTVAEHAKEALNFHISVFIYVLCCIPLVFILVGIPLALLIGIGSVVLGIIATIKASEGELYRYPATLRLVS